MTVPPLDTGPSLPKAANDNRQAVKPLRVIVNIPQSLPVQLVEVEVFASLLDDLESLVANDNQEAPE